LGEACLPSSSDLPSYPRKVNATRYYDYMAEAGINFGPEFRRLDRVSASATEQLATAEIADISEELRKPFAMHPASMDACFQLLIVAQTHGLGRNFTRLQVPTLIESLEVYNTGGSLKAHARGCGEHSTPASIECMSAGQLALHLSGFRMTPVEDSLDPDFDVHAAARLEWVPDFDFVDVAPLFKPPVSDREETRMLEELTLLCIVESAKKLEGLSPCQPHFVKLREWLQREMAAAEAGQSPLVAEPATCVTMSPEDRRAKLNDLHEKLMGRTKVGLTEGLKRICDNCDRIFTGEAETIDILMQDGVLTELYNTISFGYTDFVRLLSSTKPTLRILEVGAGTGGTTELILRDLVHEGGLPRYSTYTFTDISAGFFPQAKQRFAYAANMEYKVFDISKDPLAQGFIPDSYDLIVAANVVHATPSLKESLGNLNKLLKPAGMLILTEICTELKAPTYIFGNFIGWWLGENDDRLYEPYVHPDRWDAELRASGYTGVETAVYDEDPSYRCCTTIMSLIRRHRRTGSRFSQTTRRLASPGPWTTSFSLLDIP
jgi:SAM-dependent methyltransferase